ncbi:MAG: hypothetical protein NZ601_05815, partial [candidate division WOR-3 bacterium]|nr:hypothetical protein [candidate division WOR-3 bacterium]
DNSLVTSLNSSDYYLITGWRNGFGDVYVRLKKIKPQLDTAKYVLILTLPENIEAGDLVVRNWRTPPTLHKYLRGNTKTLIIIFDESEASRSTIINAQKTLNDFQGKLIFIPVSKELLPPELEVKNYELVRNVNLIKTLGITNFPSIIYLQGPKCLFWTEGLNLELSRLIKHFDS